MTYLTKLLKWLFVTERNTGPICGECEGSGIDIYGTGQGTACHKCLGDGRLKSVFTYELKELTEKTQADVLDYLKDTDALIDRLEGEPPAQYSGWWGRFGDKIKSHRVKKLKIYRADIAMRLDGAFINTNPPQSTKERNL